MRQLAFLTTSERSMVGTWPKVITTGMMSRALNSRPAVVMVWASADGPPLKNVAILLA